MSRPPRYLLARSACALAIFSALMGSTAPSPLYPIYLETLGLSHAMGTAIFAIYALGTLFALLLCARLAARVSDLRRLILPGLVVTAAGALIFSQAGSLHMLLLGRFLNGFGTGAITGMASAALYDLAAPGRRGMAATLATLAFTGGAAGGPLVSSAALSLALAPTVTPFLVIVAIAALAFAGLCLAAWPSPEARAGAAAESARRPAAGSPRGGSSMPLFLLACVTVTTAWMLGSMLMALGANLGTNLYGLTAASIAGLIPATFQLFAGLGQAVCGKARSLQPILLGLLGMAVLQGVLVLAAPGAHGLVLMVAMPFCGFAYGAAFVGALGLASAAAAPERRATFISRFYIVGYVSNALPTLMVGLASDRVGLGPAFYAFSAVLVAAALASAGLALKVRGLHAATMARMAAA